MTMIVILLALLSLAASTSIMTTTATSASAGISFSIELIHRDSPRSPFYNHSATSLDRARAAIYRSAHQSRRISARAQRKESIEPSSDMVSKVVPGWFEYLMELRLGTPAFSILAIVDTGSDLIWVNCVPCTQCHKQRAPLFDPRNSSSYRTLPCDSNTCKALRPILPHVSCGAGNSCQYQYVYAGGSKTEGILGTESLTFDSSSSSAGGGAPVVVSNIVFGCSSQSSDDFDSRDGGLAGFASSPLSLFSQLAPSLDKRYFSYCLVPNSEAQASSSKLVFGSSGVVAGNNMVTTPMTVDEFYFVLRLEEIIVDGAGSVPVPPASNNRFIKTGNIIMDTGTTMIYLPAGVVSSLVNEVSRVVSLPKATDPDNLLPLCFRVTGEAADWQKSLPFITFKFAGEASVRLSPTNMFVQEAEQVVCLAVVDAAVGSQDIPIFGNLAQQNLHVGYDLDVKTVSFATADCTKL